MIKIRLKELANKLNKTISDISRETGINRNTITALYHGKVDGIKFPTLEKICATYNVKIEDILLFSEKKSSGDEKVGSYRQEGEAVPFTLLQPSIKVNDLDRRFFDFDFGDGDVYLKETYGYFYWRKSNMDKISKYVYDRYSSKSNFDSLYREYEKTASEIEGLYFKYDKEQIVELKPEEIKNLYKDISDAYDKFWGISLFIDGFDAGFDQEKIKEIAESKNISARDISIFTTPSDMTYNNERVLALLEIVKKIKRKKISKEEINSFLDDYMKTSKDIKEYVKRFDYYKSNYAEVKHITNSEIKSEIIKFLDNPEEFEKKYKELKDYSANQKKKIRTALRKYKLRENPLYFFNKLTFWREHRKMVNLMGIHILFDILDAIEKQVGISVKYLRYLSFNEVSNVLSGQVNEKELKERYEKGVLFSFRGNSYKMLVGKEAESVKNEYDEMIRKGKGASTISGHVASQGYAKGIARIILDQNSFDNLKEGEILVTGMTRPEFVPVMKKSAAIVTNEGGITCHAAIVSRELGKPCIIGTQNATELIKDGDLIEVRANHGTVRILKSKE